MLLGECRACCNLSNMAPALSVGLCNIHRIAVSRSEYGFVCMSYEAVGIFVDVEWIVVEMINIEPLIILHIDWSALSACQRGQPTLIECQETASQLAHHIVVTILSARPPSFNVAPGSLKALALPTPSHAVMARK
jgi:hypothetical protein